jgi:hypothetical protein
MSADFIPSWIEGQQQMSKVKEAPIRAPRPASFATQVLTLAPGESVCRIKPIDQTLTIARIPEELPAMRQQLRNAVTPAVTRAKEVTGATYAIEVGDVQMPSGMFYAVAVITRTND